MMKVTRVPFNKIGTKLGLGLDIKRPKVQTEWVEIKINPDGSIIMRASSNRIGEEIIAKARALGADL